MSRKYFHALLKYPQQSQADTFDSPV